MAHVNFLCGDRGGFNSVSPLFLRAHNHEHSYSVYLTATVGYQFLDETLPLALSDRFVAIAGPPTDACIHSWIVGTRHSPLVIGTSQSEKGSLASSSAVKFATFYGRPVLIVEDMYGTAAPMLTQVHHEGNIDSVNCVCVGDTFAHQNIVRQFPQLEGKVIVTGAPQFDNVSEVRANWPERRTSLRRRLEIDETEIVFLVVGQLNGTVEVLKMIEQAALELRLGRRRILLGVHPRATAQEQYEVDDYVARNRGFTMISRLENQEPLENYLPAADFVGSGYATINWLAVLCEMPGVVYFGTPTLQQDLVREKNIRVPIEITGYQAAWYIKTAEGLATAIKEVLEKRGAQFTRFAAVKRQLAQTHDGRAAERVWEQIKQHLPS